MTERYPRLRLYARNGWISLREGFNMCFYMQPPATELGPRILSALEAYLRTVGQDALQWSYDYEGEQHDLDDAYWQRARREIQEGTLNIHLSSGEGLYHFEFWRKSPDLPALKYQPNGVSAVMFFLPIEYLEEHGPARVRALALEIGVQLPFCSGHAGLAFSRKSSEIWEWCLRYPGFDRNEVERVSWEIGTKLRGVAWLNFIGPPTLHELGGAEALRSRLRSPGTTVQEMDAERVVVTLGPEPEAGDMEKGLVLPPYRELARVLESWLLVQKLYTPEDHTYRVRWERRFLDLLVLPGGLGH